MNAQSSFETIKQNKRHTVFYVKQEHKILINLKQHAGALVNARYRNILFCASQLNYASNSQKKA